MIPPLYQNLSPLGYNKRIIVAAAGGFPTNGIIDDCNRSNGNNVYGNGPWRSTPVWTGDTYLRIISNAIGVSGGTWGDAWTTATYTACEAFAIIVSGNTYNEIMARVTGNTGNPSYYSFYWDNTGGSQTQWFLAKTQGGIGTQLGTWVHGSPVAGEKFGITAVGTTIKAWYYTGGVWTNVITVTDSSIASGGIGFELSGNSVIDDFGGGSL